MRFQSHAVVQTPDCRLNPCFPFPYYKDLSSPFLIVQATSADTGVGGTATVSLDAATAMGCLPPLWSAETPDLYALVMELQDAHGTVLEYESCQVCISMCVGLWECWFILGRGTTSVLWPDSYRSVTNIYTCLCSSCRSLVNSCTLEAHSHHCPASVKLQAEPFCMTSGTP